VPILAHRECDPPRRLINGNALILIVEGEPHIAEILESYFAREGFRTVTAGDGETAIQHHHTLAPDLVLLDVPLHKRDGYEVLAAIQRRAATPVIMCIGLAKRCVAEETAQLPP